MSSEMVACIAVESLSILEKMHSKGYVLVISSFTCNLKFGETLPASFSNLADFFWYLLFLYTNYYFSY